MAQRVVDTEPEFWLPAEFLTDEDILMDQKLNPNQFCFPSEFPFDFDVVANSSDVDTQLAELTRQLGLNKPPRITAPHRSFQGGQYGNLGSPQSTLFQFGGYSRRSPESSNDGSPNGPSQVSSPTSHFPPQTSSLDLINQAAAQVAKLKINSQQAPSALYNSFVQRVREEHILKNEQQRRNSIIYQQQQQQQQKQNRFSGLYVGGYLENDETAWPSLQYMNQQNVKKRSGNGSVFPNSGSGNGCFNTVRKSPSVGTGVFLPRPYENSCVPTKSNKKTGCSTTTYVRRGAQTAHSQFQPRSDVLCSDYELHLAQKNAMLIHQRRTQSQQQVAIGHELGLPQEWTY